MVNTAPSPKRQRNAQLIEAAQHPDALLTVETVSALAGLSRSTVYEFEREGRFPQAVRMGIRCTRWRAGDVTDWLKAQVPSAPTKPVAVRKARPATPHPCTSAKPCAASCTPSRVTAHSASETEQPVFRGGTNS